jgi:hypothetical protein
MAVAEEEFLSSNKVHQENWLLVDLDASFSDAVSSKDFTPTLIVFFTVLNIVFCFVFILVI